MTDRLTHARANQLIDQLSRVLRDEIAAIGRGDLANVETLFPKKAQLLEDIETAFVDAGPLLEGDEPASTRLRQRLAALQTLIRSDLALLRRMTEATGAVAREIERIRDRHSLNGLYTRDGAAQTGPVGQPQRLDQSV
ncbi:hypothetical protein [Pseudooceanicola sp. LIPI14-2-Ac024]|uniref:hypothetical protein n=1 Tax=Pseudooceanicola sp. LIPI14-2-Ac024 TaxID=3344875 RepID=UPI0035CFE280